METVRETILDDAKYAACGADCQFSNLSLEQEQAEDDTRFKMKGHIEVVDVDDNGNRKVISSEDIRIK